MSLLKRSILFILLVVLLLPATAQDTIVQQKRRPKVGLVLAGGGARGASFIGVLKYFDELNIPVDYVIGTSMGSVIGCLYALGYSPDEMQKIITEVDWTKLLGNSIDRSLLSSDMRERRSSQLVSIPISTEDIYKRGLIQSFFSELPSAYVNNTELDNMLNDLCQGYQGDVDFDKLPIPFACVATDIVTSEEIVIRSGNLPKSVRASIAIPGLFSPVVVNGRLLYDGGLTNILPSDVIRDMDVDIVIGIEFSNEKFFTGDKIPHFSKIFDYVYNFVIHEKREENKELCDILIKPNAAEFGPLSFTPRAIDTLIERGYEEAKNYHDQLMELKHQLEMASDDPLPVRTYNKKFNLDQSIAVRSISLEGPDQKYIKWLKRKGKLKENSTITIEDIKKTVGKYRGTGYFDAISYKLVPSDSTGETQDLSFNINPWTTPDIVGAGVRFDTKEGPAILLTGGINERKISGLKFKLKGRISFSPRVNAAFAYTLFPIANFNIAYDCWWPYTRIIINDDIRFNIRSEIHDVKAYLSTFEIQDFDAQMGLAFVASRFGQVTLNDPDKDSIDISWLVKNYFKSSNMMGPYASLTYDNLDKSNFACHGIYANVTSHAYYDVSEWSEIMCDMSFNLQAYITPFDYRFTIVPQVYGRFLSKPTQFFTYQTVIGEEIAGRHSSYQLPFIGLYDIHTTGDNTIIMRCDLRYRFYGNHYISGIYNYIPDHYRKDFSGVGLCYSYDSLFGPFSVLAQWSDYNNKVSAIVSFGLNF